MALTTRGDSTTNPDKPDAVLATGLVRLAHLVQDLFAQTAADHELTAAQARLLCVLTEGPRVMSELASILGVEKAAITGLVDRIERRGLVQRTGVPGDRRAYRVRLTPTGEGKALAAHQDILRALNRLVYGISPAEQHQLRQTVLHLTERASTQRS